MRILSINSVPVYRQALLALCAAEWPDMKSIAVASPKISIPAPLVALDSKNELLGGLVFSQFARPERADLALWINAVVVRDDCRGQGIASRLIAQAEAAARATGASEQFVFTQFPGLYQKLGWQVVTESAQDTVLSFSISP